MRLETYSKLSWALLTTLSLSVGVTWAYAPVESRLGSDGKPALVQSGMGVDPNVAQMQKVDFLQQEVQELRGKVEELTYQVQQLQEQQKKLYLDLEKRIGEKKASTSSNSSSSTSSSNETGISFDDLENHSSSSQTNAGKTATSSQSEEKVYRQAYQFVQNRDWGKALSAFQSFVKEFPQGKYTANAHYWMGEIYFNKGEYDLAKESFSTVYQKFASHTKAADALLKLGYVEQAKGKYKDSKALLTKVKTQYPGTTPAQLAETRLQKLHQEGRI